MSDVFVVEALRTPFGSFGGNLAEVPAPQLAATVIKALVARTGIPVAQIDQFIAGHVIQGGTGQAPARQAMRAAGLPDSIPAMTINKVCGSGLKAMMLAADAIRLGDDQLAIAGGMENMSLAPYALPQARYGMRMGNGEAIDLLIHDALRDPFSGRHMGEVTEVVVAEQGLNRQVQDEYALNSYHRAQAAQANGFLAREIVPVVKTGRKGEVQIDQDEEPARIDFDKFTRLRTVFKKDGTLTAGNASSINDGAAFALLASGAACKKLGLKARAKLVAYATNSLHPDLFPLAPVGAIERVCAKAGLTLNQIDLFEINEAFAAVTLLAIKNLHLDREKVNVNGGACALGHPVGASGGRLVATLLNGLETSGGRYGLATLCIGGGEAVAAIFERI
ncbi:MAG: thiolase family protein [Deltaproteobacteria bacterium]|nr:thiolase family protein [Deltaproteobacteria bacterium]